MTATEVLVVLAALVVGSLVKSVTGSGLPLIALPIMSLFISVEDAVVIIAAPNVALNASLAWRERSHRHETRDLVRVSAFGIVGAVVGSLLLSILPERAVILALAAMVFIYLARYLTDSDSHVSMTASKQWSPVVGFGAGVSQGATGISGPIVVTWFHAYRLTPGAHIFSVTVMFALTAAAQLLVFIADGRLFDLGTEAALTFVPVFAVMPFGSALRRRLSGEAFNRAVLAVLTISALALVFRAAR